MPDFVRMRLDDSRSRICAADISRTLPAAPAAVCVIYAINLPTPITLIRPIVAKKQNNGVVD